MSTVFSFESRPYLKELDVEVLAVEEKSGLWEVLLDDTILYPEAGGQPADQGLLGGITVQQVIKSADGVRHVLEAPVELGPARLELDWNRRYDHMQQHTAQHVLTRTALDRFDWTTRSFHIGPEVSDIELDCEPPGRGDIEALEDAVSEIIAAARRIMGYRVSAEEFATLEVRSRGLPANHRGDIRLVEIEGFDLNTCGGTHLASTAEVGAVKVVGSERLRGGCRLFWVAGKRVCTRLAARDRTLAEMRRILDTGDSGLLAALELKLTQLQTARRARRELETRLAELYVRDLASRDETLVEFHWQGSESGLLRPVAEGLSEHLEHRLAFLTAEDRAGAAFALVAGRDEPSLGLQDLGSAVAELLEGRGGGKGRVFQGKAGTLSRRAQAIDLIRHRIE